MKHVRALIHEGYRIKAATTVCSCCRFQQLCAVIGPLLAVSRVDEAAHRLVSTCSALLFFPSSSPRLLIWVKSSSSSTAYSGGRSPLQLDSSCAHRSSLIVCATFHVLSNPLTLSPSQKQTGYATLRALALWSRNQRTRPPCLSNGYPASPASP